LSVTILYDIMLHTKKSKLYSIPFHAHLHQRVVWEPAFGGIP